MWCRRRTKIGVVLTSIKGEEVRGCKASSFATAFYNHAFFMLRLFTYFQLLIIMLLADSDRIPSCSALDSWT